MFRLIVALIIVYLVYRLGKVLFLPSAGEKEQFPAQSPPAQGEDMVQDPYCNTYVPMSDAYKTSIDGTTLYFCSEECAQKYRAERKTKS